MKFLTMVKSAENSGPPPRALMDGLARLGGEGGRAGVSLEAVGLMPSAMGARVRPANGSVNFTDGPFAESKEVIGGYAVYTLKSKADAVYWAKRFIELHREHWPDWEGEAELRPIFDPGAASPAGP